MAGAATLCALAAPGLLAGLGAQTGPDRIPVSPEGDACSQLVSEGTAAGRAGDLEAAERALGSARVLCPGSADALRELAGLRFRQGRYVETVRLAESLTERAPDDNHAWRMLAAARFLLDDPAGALRAWNRLDRPLAGRIRIEGADRTPIGAVWRAVALSEGDRVTPEALSRAVRRVQLLPTVSRARVAYRPAPGADPEVDLAVDVETHIAERRSLPGTWPELLGHGARAVGNARIALEAAGPAGAGELWRGDWSWQARHQAVELALAAPGGALPGVWTMTMGERRGAYRLSDRESPSEPVGVGPVHRDAHRFARVEVTDWVSAAALWELGASLDRWPDRGGFAGVRGALELRWPHEPTRERAALRASGRAWRSPATREGFGSLRVQAAARSIPGPRRVEWIARIGMAASSDHSPPSLWETAGAGRPSTVLLRAHPSLDGEGVLHGPLLGPGLFHAGLELRGWLHRLGPIRIGPAAFAEGVRVRAPPPMEEVTFALDVGAGLRLEFPGVRGALRADLAHGVVDGARAASLGWMPGWPGWW